MEEKFSSPRFKVREDFWSPQCTYLRVQTEQIVDQIMLTNETSAETALVAECVFIEVLARLVRSQEQVEVAFLTAARHLMETINLLVPLPEQERVGDE